MQRGAHVVTAYPALVDEGETVGVRVVPTAAEASRLAWRGARRLLVLVAGSPAKQVVKSLSPRSRLALQFNPDGEIPDLVADCVDAAADELIAAAGGPPRDEAAFAALVQTAKAELPRLTADTVRKVEDVLTQAREVAVAIGAAPGRRVPEAAIADLRRQMGGLLHRGFVAATGRRRLPDVVRYLRAMAHRLEKLPANAARDELWMAQVAAVAAEYEQLRAQVPGHRRPGRPGDADPLDGRGAPGGPVRPGHRHAAAGVRAARLQGDRPAHRVTANRPDRSSRSASGLPRRGIGDGSVMSEPTSHTEAAGAGVSDEEMVETVAEQTDSASENADTAGKDWNGDASDAPAPDDRG